MTLKISKWDTSEILDTEEAIEEYLEVVQEDGDIADVIKALANIARARNMTELAEKAGMSRKGLYKALSGESSPEYVTIARIAEALGLKLTLSIGKSAA